MSDVPPGPDPENIGREHALEAIDDAETEPVDADGRILLPHAPQKAGYEALAEKLNRDPSERQRELYENRFFETVREHLERHYPAEQVEEWIARR